MKICFVGAYPVSETDMMGGVANVIRYLASELVGQGHEVHIVTTTRERNLKSQCREGAWVHFINAPPIIPRVFTNPTIIRARIHRRIERLNPDIVHFHGSAAYALGLKMPHVQTLHGVQELDVLYVGGRFAGIKSLLLRAVESYARAQEKNIILINPYIHDVLKGDISGVTWDIENPVDPVFFNAKPGGETNNILYAGMIHQRKNVLGVIQAFKACSLEYPDLQLKIAGPVRDSDYYQACVNYISENSLADKVVFLGSLNKAEMVQQLEESRCLILISYQETAPLIIGEAMACGVPVVASNVGGVRYMVKEHVTGCLVDADDSATIAERLKFLVGHVDTAMRMGESARKEALARFEIKSVVAKTLEVYGSVIASYTAGNEAGVV